MADSDKMPEQNSILTPNRRKFLLKSEDERSKLKQNTLDKTWSRIKKRVHAGMWDFGLLFSQMDSDKIGKYYDGPEPTEREIENISRVSLEGFSDHAANVVAFLYRALPYSVFLRAIEAGIFRGEHEGEGRRMISVNIDSSAIERMYAPTEENEDKYDIDALRNKLQSGEELGTLERMAVAQALELYEDSTEVRDAEKKFSPRSEQD